MIIRILFFVGLMLLAGCATGKEGSCILMRHNETGELGCFGCAGSGGVSVCKDPTTEMVTVEVNSDRCDITENGCVLKD